MKLTKKDIQSIAKDNEFSEINFDSWIAYETRQRMSCREALTDYHIDIITILKHLQSIYETGRKQPLHIKTTIEDCIDVAHFQAQDEEYKERTKANRFYESMWAYDIYFLLRDTRAYLQNQLDFKVMNRYYDL